MQREPDLLGPWEHHCYFPEWADRPEAIGRLLETDRNSYSAGGYSEEFGYTAIGRAWALAPPHENPERSEQWCVQIGGLHPGYPQCPRPADRSRGAGRTGSPVGHAIFGIPGARPALQGTTHVLRVERRTAAWPLRITAPIAAALRRVRMRRKGLGRFI